MSLFALRPKPRARTAFLGLVASLAVLAPLALPRVATAEITIDGALQVQILLDHSGSMYPGYQPAGLPRQTFGESGSRYYAQYPEFAAWMDDFVAAQKILGARRVSLAALASGPSPSASDARQLFPPGAIDGFRFASLVPRLPEAGSRTFLAEGLATAASGFDGLVWLITDNIVETGSGVPDRDVERFFQELADTDRYRAVHLYKLPFSTLVTGRPGNLAVYGILISPRAVPAATQLYFDQKMRGEFLEARRASAPRALFPQQPYWKLKDLSIGALELELKPKLEVEIVQERRSIIRERQTVRLRLVGRIKSRLTQHRVVGGTFTLEPVGDFIPGGTSGRDFGLQPIPAEIFGSFRGTLPKIEPRGDAPIVAELVSNQPIPLETHGLSAWLRSASSGVTVPFTGTVQATFSGLAAEFDHSQMEGIFGARAAPEIFRIRQRVEIRTERSDAEPVTFELTSGYGRMLLFVLLLLLALGLLFGLFWLFGRSYRYRARVGGEESFFELRRLQSKAIRGGGYELGRLSRGLTDTGSFAPSTQLAAVKVTPSSTPGLFDVLIRDQPATSLTLERLGGGPVPARTAPPGRGPSNPSSPAPPRGGRSASPGSSSPTGRPSSRRATIRRPGT